MTTRTSLRSGLTLLAALGLYCPQLYSQTECRPAGEDSGSTTAPACPELEQITIFGSARDVQDVAGGANYISPQELEAFDISDVARALRRVPGVSLQIEDGWALRPNISIRGTATERSSRVTLMEDNVLIAPAPYAASSAYYFPTFGRIHAVEILKGPAAITQGPYTVGGAVNMISTPIPTDRQGFLQGEFGSDDTWRVHAWYGDRQDRFGYLIETHQWQSDGYQAIDRSEGGTGLDKEDYLAKLAFYSAPGAKFYQELEIKLQASDESSQQSYLGLTDHDFQRDPLRRYGVSSQDEMNNDHDQVALSWRIETDGGLGATLIAYSNRTKRAWYKTEAFDFDGSASPESFSGTGWAGIVSAINAGGPLGGQSAEELQAILDGADTSEGSVQVRNNSREYDAKGIQLVVDKSLAAGSARHILQAGIRYHEDDEDRLQRNDNYQQSGGLLLLNSTGLEGNAGNQVQSAEAWAFYVFDRIEWESWTLTPGLRYETIDLERVRYRTDGDNPASRDPSNSRDRRSNEVDIWLPGMGGIYRVNDRWSAVAGVHKGFAVPGNQPGVDPEESINYEYGFRYQGDNSSLEVIGFFNDYSNLVGVCTNSSGNDCVPGDAFNGDAVQIPGLEVSWNTSIPLESGWEVPLRLAYTWMNAEFQSDFNSEFFGEVQAGDPVPYVPDNQLWFGAALQNARWSFDLSFNFVDGVCTSPECGTYEKTQAATVIDLAAHYRLTESLSLYGIVENAGDDLYIAGRQPYGARTNKPRTYVVGARWLF
jgi:Fe(3+) dicitrate transport protein